VISAAAVAAIVTAGGCLVVSESSSYERGVKVSQATLAQVEPGITTEAWVLATLGEPTARTEVEGRENVSILVYRHQRHQSSGGAVFLLFAGEQEHTTKSTAYFEITDGIVTRHWVED
jgi:outer membrane protein assembly factor BamE (lipoprotein component of BamABCDE complex)